MIFGFSAIAYGDVISAYWRIYWFGRFLYLSAQCHSSKRHWLL